MKRLESKNLFELEGLEQRILLSGDPFVGVGALSAGILDETDSLFDTDPGLSFPERGRAKLSALDFNK